MTEHRDGKAGPMPASERFGWRAVVATVALHAVGLAVATYPTFLTLGSTLPGGSDTFQHLRVMR
jgi:hypothetical protein